MYAKNTATKTTTIIVLKYKNNINKNNIQIYVAYTNN